MSTKSVPALQTTTLSILLALSISHLLNDMIQSLLPAIYPILKRQYELSFTQIGIITLVYQIIASLLQPFVGLVTDRKPLPYLLPVGMGATLMGLIVLAFATNFPLLLLGAAFIGMGSSVFHPESSRMARLAAGAKHGMAQSIFQIGGNAGSAIGPLIAAFVILPHGQQSVAFFCVAALAAMAVLSFVSRWYHANHLSATRKTRSDAPAFSVDRRTLVVSMTVLVLLVISKYFYLASLTSYYTFFLMARFSLSEQLAQFHLFVFLAAVAAGTLAGGYIGDRIGRKVVIWFSILGVLPFTLALPFANLLGTEILSVIIGLILASAFSAIIVYAQELAPGRTGMIAGLFFGLAFGVGGLGAAICGRLADAKGIEFVYHLASYLPAAGMLAIFLPRLKEAPATPR